MVNHQLGDTIYGRIQGNKIYTTVPVLVQIGGSVSRPYMDCMP